MRILGINAYHPDASVVLLEDGRLLWAAEEERFDRVKHSWGFPAGALRRCIEETGIAASRIDHVATSKRPKSNRWRKVRYVLGHPPTPTFLRNVRRIRSKGEDLETTIERVLGWRPESIVRVEHHLAHAASTFCVSGFDRAAVLSLDGLGDFCSTLWGVGSASGVQVLGRVHFPHSAGFLYMAGTQFLGFPEYGDEYKVMGLAAYGRPRYLDTFRRMVRLDPGGGFRLNLDYFTHHRSQGMVFLDWKWRLDSALWAESLGPPRTVEEPIEERHADIAASLQQVLEEVYFHLLQKLQTATGETRLCVAGGVAFNSVANGKIEDRTRFEETFIQPAAGDAGTALGAAAFVHQRLGGDGPIEPMRHAYLGGALPDEQTLRSILTAEGLQFEQLDERQLVERTARAIADGQVVGWCQGRMEFGPRALGNRSILADPRRDDMKKLLNEKIKLRESFRPFAPSVPVELANAWFMLNGRPSPYMLCVVPVRPEQRAQLPAVTHVDGTARPQTVDADTNPRFWKLLHAFGRLTGVPILLNTSFNENEPIVHTPDEAIDCFRRTDMDLLVLGDFYLQKI